MSLPPPYPRSLSEQLACHVALAPGQTLTRHEKQRTVNTERSPLTPSPLVTAAIELGRSFLKILAAEHRGSLRVLERRNADTLKGGHRAAPGKLEGAFANASRCSVSTLYGIESAEKRWPRHSSDRIASAKVPPEPRGTHPQK
jgi:hypothetical protein